MSDDLLLSLSMNHNNSGASHLELVSNLFKNSLIKTERLKEAFLQLDRKEFVPHDLDPYEDVPKAIGSGATITSPHMHAIAVEGLLPSLAPGKRGLDIGSGSGYVTALMAVLCEPEPLEGKVGTSSSSRVIGVDHSAELVKKSEASVAAGVRSDLLNSGVLSFHCANGLDLSIEGPFDAIHVGAAFAYLPNELLELLAPHGRMVIPVEQFGTLEQSLLLVTKQADGTIQQEKIMACIYSKMERTTHAEKQAAEKARVEALELEKAELAAEIEVAKEDIKAWHVQVAKERGEKPSARELLVSEPFLRHKELSERFKKLR